MDILYHNKQQIHQVTYAIKLDKVSLIDNQSSNLETKLGYNIQTYVYLPGTESLWFFTPSYRANEGFGYLKYLY